MSLDGSFTDTDRSDSATVLTGSSASRPTAGPERRLKATPWLKARRHTGNAECISFSGGSNPP
jgi:hypothetical protein